MARSFEDIIRRFHSMPKTKFEIPEQLEAEWVRSAIAYYNLNIGTHITYDELTLDFDSEVDEVVCNTLAEMVYASYLKRELSRVMALNGIIGKDVQLTGQDATKRVTKQEYDDQVAYVETLLTRQKTPAYG